MTSLVEIGVGVAPMAGFPVKLAALFASVLFTVFAAYSVALGLRDVTGSCGCGGVPREGDVVNHYGRAVGCGVLAVVAVAWMVTAGPAHSAVPYQIGGLMLVGVILIGRCARQLVAVREARVRTPYVPQP